MSFPLFQRSIALRSKFAAPTATSSLQIPGDFVEFASLCRIISGSRLVKFELWEFQQRLATLLESHNFHCWYKTRQLGVSELIVSFMLQRSLANPYYTGVSLSIRQMESSKLGERAGGMLSGVSWEFRNQSRLKSTTGGNLYFYPSTENAARSLPSVTDLFFDEAGFIEHFLSCYASASPSQSMAGEDAKRIIVTTIPPDGILNPVWGIFSSDCPLGINPEAEIEAVRQGRSSIPGFSHWIDDAGWCKVLIHWRAHPVYRRVENYLITVKRREKMPDEKLYREFDLALPKGGGSLFNLDAVAMQAVGQWEQAPVRGRKYMMAIDPNFGAEDFYCILVLDISTFPYKVVWQSRRNRCTNQANKRESIEAIKTWKPVLVSVEVVGGAILVLEGLEEALPYTRFEGVKTTTTSKPILCDRVAYAIENGEVVYPPNWEFCSPHPGDNEDKLDPSEAQTFSAVNLEAAYPYHDDTVMSLAMAFAWVSEAAKLAATVSAPLPSYSPTGPAAARKIFGGKK